MEKIDFPQKDEKYVNINEDFLKSSDSSCLKSNSDVKSSKINQNHDENDDPLSNSGLLDTSDMSISSKFSDLESEVYKNIKGIFTEYMLTDIQSLGAFKFIKDSFLNKTKDTDRVRKWILNKVNKKTHPKEASKFQLGCPDVCPGIRIKPFHDPNEFDFIKELIKHTELIREELLALRNTDKSNGKIIKNSQNTLDSLNNECSNNNYNNSNELQVNFINKNDKSELEIKSEPKEDVSKTSGVKSETRDENLNISNNLNESENKFIPDSKQSSGFQPYRNPNYVSNIKSKDGLGSLAHDSGEWNVFYLFLHEMKFDSNCSKCPKTVELIQKLVPRQY